MEVTSLKGLLDWEPPKVNAIIDHGILLPDTRLVIFGLWKSWKSMFTQHVAFCVSCGLPLLGFNTTKSSILLVQLEIPKAEFKKRVAKYAGTHELYPDNLNFACTHYLKLDRDAGKASLDRILQGLQPEVLVIDPVYKVLSGNISDSYDIMKLLGNLGDLQARHHFSLILVTHTRKPHTDDSGEVVDRGLEEIMGSSYLPNWLDTAIGIKVIGQDVVQISFPAMRHAEVQLDPIKVRVNRSTLGFSPLLAPIAALNNQS